MPGAARVRLRDLSVNDPDERRKLHETLDRFLDHGMWILGPEVLEFERFTAARFNRRFCVGVSSASSGLYLALKALEIGPGDEVITTPMSWLVTSSAILLAGATPVFVDVDHHYNLDPDCVEQAITRRTKAILPVHFYGRVAAMPEIITIARKHGLRVIEDVAQAVGAELLGTPAGSFGDIGVLSFSPMKVVPSLGDAGAVICDDEAVADRVRSLRHCGTVHAEICIEPELKHTIDALQAAVIVQNLNRAGEVIESRRRLARRYLSRLSQVVICPDLGEERRHTMYDFTIRTRHRPRVIEHLISNRIETKVRHPILISDQPIYRHLPRPKLPNAEHFVQQILCLPMHQNLTDSDIDFVCDRLLDCERLF
jgi:dTDP-4-amino-4,6-dideoxygalactose transaminase